MNAYELEGYDLIGTEYFGPVLEAAFVNKLPPDSTLVRDGATIYIYRPKTEPWSGEGLPPVGTVCQYNDLLPTTFIDQELKWSDVRIVSHDIQYGDTYVVFSSLSGYSANRRPECFRPIRTPEQIAAEVRDREIADLYFTINWNEGRETWPIISNGRKADYAKAIDAGYRKFEIADDSDPA